MDIGLRLHTSIFKFGDRDQICSKQEIGEAKEEDDEAPRTCMKGTKGDQCRPRPDPSLRPLLLAKLSLLFFSFLSLFLSSSFGFLPKDIRACA